MNQFLCSVKRFFVISCFTIVLLGCGASVVVPKEGGTSGGMVAREAVLIGPITQVSPLTVNDITVGTDASFTAIETQDVDGRGLRVGMIVRVDGGVVDDADPPTRVFAEKITSGAELHGTVSEISLGSGFVKAVETTVSPVSNVVFEEGVTSLSDLQFGDSIQVHGYPLPNGVLFATRVTKTSVTTSKVTGFVAGGTCPLCLPASSDFLLGALTVRFGGAELTGVSLPLANGSLVSVTGALATTSRVLNATRIDRYAGSVPGEGSFVSIRGGFIGDPTAESYNFVGIPTKTTKDTQFALLPPTPNFAPLIPGAILQVSGSIVDGVLVAEQVGEIRR